MNKSKVHDLSINSGETVVGNEYVPNIYWNWHIFLLHMSERTGYLQLGGNETSIKITESKHREWLCYWVWKYFGSFLPVTMAHVLLIRVHTLLLYNRSHCPVKIFNVLNDAGFCRSLLTHVTHFPPIFIWCCYWESLSKCKTNCWYNIEPNGFN